MIRIEATRQALADRKPRASGDDPDFETAPAVEVG